MILADVHNIDWLRKQDDYYVEATYAGESIGLYYKPVRKEIGKKYYTKEDLWYVHWYNLFENFNDLCLHLKL